jgi:hypothetical protein
MAKATTKQWRFELIFAPSSDLKEVQKKLNQWKSTGLYIKHRITPGADGFLFEVCLWKAS